MGTGGPIVGDTLDLPHSYCGAAPMPHDLWSRWNGDPMLFAALVALAGWSIAAIRSGDQGGRHGLTATAILAFLYLSPFCSLGAALFTVRVVHHLALALVIAPLLALALGPRLNQLPGSLAAWTLIDAVALWAWHAPLLYQMAATGDAAYWAMQLTILAASTMFWARLFSAGAPAAVAALLAAMVQMGALGALLALSPSALFPAHFATTGAWGMTPLEDQQLAGLVMWAPAAAFYLVAAMLNVRRMVAMR